MTQVLEGLVGTFSWKNVPSRQLNAVRFFLVRYVTLLIPGACCLLKLSYLRVCLCHVEEKYDTPNEKQTLFVFSLQPIFVRYQFKAPAFKGTALRRVFPSDEFPLLAAFL